MTVKGVEDSDETRVALVTGGGTGIGAACCRALAAEGFRVGVHYRSSEEMALKLVAELNDSFAVRADLSSKTDIDELVKGLKEKAGRVDVLVNNAGYNVNAPMLSMKLDDYDAVAGMSRGTWYPSRSWCCAASCSGRIRGGSSTSAAWWDIPVTPARSPTR